MFEHIISSSGVFGVFRKRVLGSLRSEGGVSIMEVVVSILMFAMLLTTAATIIRFSLVITGDSLARATESQGVVNELVLDSFTGTSGEISFYSSVINVVSSHEVVYLDADGFVVFRPSD